MEFRKRFGPVCLLAASVAALVGANPARASWQAEMGTLRIGMLADPGSERAIAGLETLRRSLRRALGIHVEVMVARDYPALIEAQIKGRVHYAVYSAMAYGVAWRACRCVEPLAAPVAADLSTGIRAAVFVRRGAARRHGSPHPPAVVAGSEDALPAALYRAAAAGGTLNVEPSASAAERAFAVGESAALLGWISAGNEPGGGTHRRLLASGLAGTEFDVMWTSAAVRYGPHAVRADLAPAAKTALRAYLTGLREGDPEAYEVLERNFSGGFAPVGHADYAAVLDLLPPFPEAAPSMASGPVSGPR